MSVATCPPALASFCQDVLGGLQQSPKTLPCKYLYDAAGSALFDEITRLDAYYPTRAEIEILDRFGAEMADAIGPDARIVEYGSGSSAKTTLLLDRLHAPASYVPIDISREHLLEAADRLRARYPAIEVVPVHADYTAPFALPPAPGRRTVVFFPGSTIGNFEPAEARSFMTEMARVAGRDGGLLIGVDLRKDAAVLERAYDDDDGVTARFNLNLLARLNREAGATFDLSRFAHRASWNAAESRVEMHLVSLQDQHVVVAGEEVAFREGETIHTENSYKYTIPGFTDLAAAAGFEPVRRWTDAAGRFSVHYLTVGP